MPRSGTVEWIHLREKPRFGFFGGRFPLGWLDVLAIVIIVGVWIPLSLFNLGDRDAPQSFHGFGQEEYVVIDLGDTADIGQVWYYTGLGQGEYALYFSSDGEEWHRQGEMAQNFAWQFKWFEAEVINGSGVRYVRLRAESVDWLRWVRAEAAEDGGVRFVRERVEGGTIYLGELAFINTAGRQLEPGRFTLQWSNPARGGGGLFDEQHTVPDRATFMNSMYFDEIYHGQAAFQISEDLWPETELSHPPLGKILIGFGISIFGMTPFGWRFMGVAVSALILVIFYCLVKQMFGKRFVAVCSTIVFAASFMHFVQTRIATIDTYAVLFVMLQFWFIYRYVTQDYDTPFRKTLPSLALAGVFFGLGAASKWSVLYLAPALAILWLVYQILRRNHYRDTEQKGFGKYLLKTILMSCVFFLLVPGIIYYLSYIPYSSAMGYGLFSRGHLGIVVENQRFMLWFHDAVAGAEHAFSSYWWQWMFNIRPVLFYSEITPDGYRSAMMTFGNPAVYWGGLLALVAMAVAWVRRRDGRAFAILLCYFALLLPWVFIPRTSYAYHYFTNSIFLVLALAYVFDHLIRRQRGPYKTAVVAFTVVTVGLFVMFYPVLSGFPIPDWFGQNVLRWFELWPIYPVR